MSMCHFSCAPGYLGNAQLVITEAVHVHYRKLENTTNESEIKT